MADSRCLKVTDENDPEARKIYPHPGKPRSWVWGYFGFYKTDNGLDLSTAVCKLCRKTYTNKGTNFNTLFSSKLCQNIQYFVPVILQNTVYFDII